MASPPTPILDDKLAADYQWSSECTENPFSFFESSYRHQNLATLLRAFENCICKDRFDIFEVLFPLMPQYALDSGINAALYEGNHKVAGILLPLIEVNYHLVWSAGVVGRMDMIDLILPYMTSDVMEQGINYLEQKGHGHQSDKIRARLAEVARAELQQTTTPSLSRRPSSRI